MPEFIHRRWHGLHMIVAIVLMAILSVFLSFYNMWFTLLGFLMILGTAIYAWYAEKAFETDFLGYVATLTYRIRRAGDKVVQKTPVGMILYNEEGLVEWHNPYAAQLLNEDNFVSLPLLKVLPGLEGKLGEQGVCEVGFENRHLNVQLYKEEKLLFLTDVTELYNLRQRYEMEKVAVGIIHIDNQEEVAQVMGEQAYTLLMAEVVRAITDWAARNQMFIRRLSSDKFLVLSHVEQLKKVQELRFDILDVVRDMTKHNQIPITLSIGFGAGGANIVENGQMASSSLDIALGRGGDQAALRFGEQLSFYGGKSNAVEKRTRIRARVVSHALRNLILESDQVIIAGHQSPDLDAIGAAIGVLKAVRLNGKKGVIVLDQDNPSIARLMDWIEEEEELAQVFVSPEESLYLTQQRSLVVMVDNHRPSNLIEPRLLHQTKRVVVIDHHRRSEEMVNDALLVYIEPYASSTSELVTELLQYQSDKVTMSTLEATALLAGIMVDTKNFHFKTGSRTFDAASYLRRLGAEPERVQQLMQEDFVQFLRRIEMFKKTEMLPGGVAVVTADDSERYDQLLIAQTADNLLMLSSVIASFVVARRPDGAIGISARSTGDLNVQVIMEELGGGGHLSNAAAQVEAVSTQDAAERLKEVIRRRLEAEKST